MYAVVAGVVIHFIWWNTDVITDVLGIAGDTVLAQSVRAVLLTVAVWLLIAVVISPKKVFSFLGLNRNILQGLGIALICVSPMFIILPIFGKLNSEITFYDIFRKCILAGFTEELVCRAFMFGLLFRYAKTGFFWAVIIPALYFGSLHLYQGHDVVSSLAAFSVTFIGALYFSWMYVEWNFNLWVPIGLHFLMNCTWMIFLLDGNNVAAGTLISNIARVISILLAITLTVIYKRRENVKVFSYPVWQF